MTSKIKGALFIDRDGVINKMVYYKNGYDSPQSPNDVRLIKGVEKVIKFANKKRVPVIEISNQPQVAKGKISRESSEKIEKKIHKLLKEKEARIDKVYFCPHHPEAVVRELRANCECRKPKPGLLLKAAEENDINLEKSAFLGDKATDVKAGKSAGCKTVLFLHSEDEPQKIKEAKKAQPDFKVESLKEAEIILKEFFGA